MSSIHERERRWDTNALQTVMQGAWRFDDWTQRLAGSASFFVKGVPLTSPAFSVVGYHNNNGVDAGTAEIGFTFAQLGFQTTGTKESHHTVHMRMTRGNGESGMSYGIGPATALHSGGGGSPGNCYFAVMRNVAGTGKVRIGQITTGGVVGFLAEFDADVLSQDRLSLAYQYDTGDSEAELSVLVNGVVIGSHTVSSSPFRMSSLTALPGIVGLGTPAIAATTNFGHYLEEWWVTGLFEDAGQVQKTFPRMVGAVKVHLMENKRYTDSDKPKAKWLLSRALESLSFTYQRNGGNTAAKIVLVPQDWTFGTVADPMEKSMQEPYPDEWQEDDWQGGDVRILVKYHAQELLVGGSTAGTPEEELWRGRIKTVKYDRLTRRVNIACEGYAAVFKERRITDQRNNVTIRDAISSIVLAGAGRGTSWPNDGPIDTVNIVDLQSALDQKVDLDFKDVTIRSALDTLLSLLPDSMAWGVRSIATTDGQGEVEFYLQQQVDPYNVDLSGGITHPTYDADKALVFSKRADWTKIRNFATVYGEEIEQGEAEGPVERVRGSAVCRRSTQMWRTKQEVKTESSVPDAGLASKMAAAMVKSRASPKMLVSLKVLEQIDGTHSFYHLLTPFQPWLAVRERADPESLLTIRLNGAKTAERHFVHDRMIRRYGDVAGVGFEADGPAGAYVTLASTTAERALDTDWLWHIALRFDTAITDNTASHESYIGGRAADGATPDIGWGSLWWQAVTGKLVYHYRTSAGALKSIETGIVVDPTTPAGQVVNFTVWRDSGGTWRFYDGATLKTTDATKTADVLRTQSTADWRWFESTQTGGTWHEWDGVIDQFWVIDTTDLASKRPGEVANAGGFLTRTTGKSLPVDEAMGLLRHIKFNEAHYSGAVTISNPPPKNAVWTRNGLSAEPEAALYSVNSLTDTTDATPVTTAAQVVRGYRMGDESTGTTDALSVKKWGGPILMSVERATYKILPGDGTVETAFELTDLTDRLAPSLAKIENDIERISDTLRNIGEDL